MLVQCRDSGAVKGYLLLNYDSTWFVLLALLEMLLLRNGNYGAIPFLRLCLLHHLRRCCVFFTNNDLFVQLIVWGKHKQLLVIARLPCHQHEHQQRRNNVQPEPKPVFPPCGTSSSALSSIVGAAHSTKL